MAWYGLHSFDKRRNGDYQGTAIISQRTSTSQHATVSRNNVNH
ncbi:MAG: hypothetical protein PQ968_02630 [Methanobacterium sp.]|jgi:hypothetical protein